MENINIKRLMEIDLLPYHLLFLADPSEEAVTDYVQRGEVYGAFNKELKSIVGVYVLLKTRPFTIELVNVAVDENYQGRGIGKLLVKHAIEMARESESRVIEVGTGNAGIGQMALYQKCGFTIVGVDYDFFRKHYKEPIWENGIECRHMVRMSMDL